MTEPSAPPRRPSEDDAAGAGGRSGLRLHRWLIVLAGVTLAIAVGPPLVGAGSMIATDQLYTFDPWRTEVPSDVSVTGGPLSDTFDFYAPQRDLFSDRARDADLALWNPYPAGGAPLGVEPNTATFAPSNAPYLALPQWAAPAITKFLEMAAAIGFTYLFLRRLGLARSPAVVGGLVYALSGFQVVWTNWQHTRVGALIPALFWASERHLQERRVRSAIPIALVVGAMLYEGFPAVTGFALYLLAPYVAVRAWTLSGRRLRPTLAGAAQVGGGIAGGMGLAAAQLVPFLDRLGLVDPERLQTTADHSPLSTALTLAVPNALGAPFDGAYTGPDNYVEAQAFIGAAALALAVLAVLRPRIPPRAAGVLPFCLGAVAVILVLVFVGGPLLEAVQNLPVFSNNSIRRARSVLGFLLAVLAAFGIESLLSTASAPARRPGTRWAVRLGALGAIAAALAAAAWALHRAEQHGQLDYVVGGVVLAAVCAAIVGAAVVLVRRHPSRREVVVLAVGATIAVEALVWVVPYLPNIDRDDFYPSTATHEFLSDEIGHERVATHGFTLLPGATTYYRLRTVTGHVFHDPAWKEVLLRLDPESFTQSPTFSVTRASAEIVRSPILDRLSARYFVSPESEPVVGESQVLAETAGVGTLEGSAALRATIAPRDLRAVGFTLAEELRSEDPAARLDVTVRSPTGEVVATGSRRVLGPLAPGLHQVPVAGEDLGQVEGDLTVELSLDADDGRAQVGVGAAGELALTVVEPGAADGLRLVFTDGAVVYERTSSLPRVRWASQVAVAPDGEDRLDMLERGVPDDTVVLEQEGSPAGGGDADVEVVADDGDRVRVRVDAETPGYLVVADPIQHGWEARVDGDEVDVVPADHALGAVPVDAGRHEVDLVYEPRTFRAGVALSLVSLVIVVVAWAATSARGRRLVRATRVRSRSALP